MDKNNLIIDLGACYCRAGLSKEIIDENKNYTFESCLAYPKSKYEKNEKIIKNLKGKKFFIGKDEDYKKLEMSKGQFDFKWPLKIKDNNHLNYDSIENIFGHVFSEFNVDPCEQNVLLAEFQIDSQPDNEKATQIMFETFNVPNFYLANIGVLTVLSAERSTGIAITSGERATQIIPVFEGCRISWASKKLDYSGKDLTEYLIKEIVKLDYKFNGRLKNEEIKEIKDKHCYLATNENEKISPYFYQGVFIRNPLVNCPGILFPDIANECFNSINKCDKSLHKELFNSICLSGGNTMFKGFPEKLKIELEKLESKEEINIIAPPEREYSILKGGAILSNNDTIWIT